MDVDTRLLRSFAAVAAEGSLSRAAERLFVSQPALTKQIKQLESQLGVQLFTRSRAGMTLTAAGRALADRTPGMLAGWDQMLRETKAAGSRAEGVFRADRRDGDGREVTAAAAQRGDAPIRRLALEARHDHDVAVLEVRVDLLRRDVGDLRLGVDAIGNDARLRTGEGHRFLAEAVDGHGGKRDRRRRPWQVTR